MNIIMDKDTVFNQRNHALTPIYRTSTLVGALSKDNLPVDTFSKL